MSIPPENQTTAQSEKTGPPPLQFSISLATYFWRFLKPDIAVLIMSFIGMTTMAAFSVLVTMVPLILESNWHAGMRARLFMYIGGILAINLIIMVAQSVVNWMMTNVTENCVRRVKVAIMRKIGLLPCEELTYEAIGKFAQRTTGDVMRLGGLISPGLSQLLFSSAQLVFMLAALFWIDFRFALILPVVVYFVWRGVKRINEKVAFWARKDQLKQEDVLTHFIESIGGSRDLVASGRFDTAVDTYERELVLKQRFQVLAALWNNLGGMVPTACFSILIFGYYLFKITFTRFEEGTHEVGSILSYAGNLMMAQGLLLSLFKLSNDAALATPSLHELRRLLESQEVRDPEQCAPIGSGEIVFKHVDFGYGINGRAPNCSIDRPPVDKMILHDVDFHMQTGSFAAIVGQSGSGKSTIFYMLLRLLEPVGGDILLGGVPLNRIPLATLRNFIGFIPQSPFIFSGTIRENLLMGASEKDISAEKIDYAVRMAKLEELVAKRKKEGGLDAPVGAGGASLSGGERQRIALGRIFLRDPGIIVCDEYTANIDNSTAKLIHSTLKNEFAGKTRVVITHQLCTVRGADCIYVLDGGKVVERGKHEELLAQNGLYREMWEVQRIE